MKLCAWKSNRVVRHFCSWTFDSTQTTLINLDTNLTFRCFLPGLWWQTAAALQHFVQSGWFLGQCHLTGWEATAWQLLGRFSSGGSGMPWAPGGRGQGITLKLWTILIQYGPGYFLSVLDVLFRNCEVFTLSLSKILLNLTNWMEDWFNAQVI